MLHDEELARVFLAPLQALFVANAQLANPAVTVQSPPGAGWSSKAASKKGAKVTAVCVGKRPETASPKEVSTPAPYTKEFDDEVKVRLNAMEIAIRAQLTETWRSH